MSFRALLHLLGHALWPGLLARLAWPRTFWRAWLTLVLANLVDLDHLLADPIYDPGRCSIGHHPLHTLPAIAVYALLVLPRPTRVLAVGLLLHMLWDQIDCWWMRVC
ncbi:MAG TPA: DUF6122 family protein [Polyangiaceae bacterium]